MMEAWRLLETEPIHSVSDFADRVRVALRGNPLPDSVWNALFERGVEAALKQNDLDGLASMVTLVSSIRLEVDGQLDQAFSQIDLALRLADKHSDAKVALLSRRGAFELAAGRVKASVNTLAAAEAMLNGETSRFAREEYEAAAASVVLARGDLAGIETSLETIQRLELSGSRRHLLFVLSWLVPALVAAGRDDDARAWTQLLKLTAGVESHAWRGADAASFQFADDARRNLQAAPSDDLLSLASSSGNWLARWRVSAIHLRASLLRREMDEAGEALERLQSLRDIAYPAFRDGEDLYTAAVSAFAGEAAIAPHALPNHVSVMNLGAVLAGMEAVAMAGSQSLAASWLAWAEENVPSQFITALEWPVSRRRVEGLLALRAGDVRRAIRLLRRAQRHPAGGPAEEHIATLQLAEAALLLNLPVAESTRLRWRTDAMNALAIRGIDPLPHAYAAAQAVAVGRGAGQLEHLTPREAEVLRLLGRGLTFKEAAEELGLSWRTVQTHSGRAYSKLLASRRTEAIDTARELGII